MWIYENRKMKSLDDFPPKAFGFIYKITRTDGKFYIGRKNLYSERSVKLTKKDLALLNGPGRKPTKKKLKKESDWKTYYGSEPSLKEDIKKLGPNMYFREILRITYSKKETTYQELRYQILNEVLEHDEISCFNSSILGKFYRKDLF